MSYTLIGAPLSYFSGKARAYLRWRGVAFDEVLPTPDVMAEVLPVIGWPVIPVLRDSQTLVQDTADIIAHVEARHLAEHPDATTVMPRGPVQRFVTQLIHTYADQWLVLPAMHYRWNHNGEWVLGEFGRTAAPGADPDTQLAIGTKRAAMFRSMVPMLGITPQTAPAIEASYEAFLADFDAHLAVHPFVLGGRASFSDFALYGPLYAHLYRDPASGEIMRRLAPRVTAWVERLLKGDGGSGELLAGDGVPDTLLPLLARHFAEHGPVLRAVNDRLAGHDGGELPRALGTAEFEVAGVSGQTLARPFSLFRLQGALDELSGMDKEDKARALDILDRTGGRWLADMTLSRRLERRDYKLAVAK